MKEIFNRRSVRTYLDKPVSNTDLTLLLKAAMRAPSAGNEQPWEFIVLQNKHYIKELEQVSPYAKPLLNAPLAIVVCGNMEHCKFPGAEKDYWIQDCSAAIQNILLEAKHLELGGVWLGIYPNQQRVNDLSNLLKLPNNVIPLGIVSIGYPADETTPMDTYLPQRIHIDKW